MITKGILKTIDFNSNSCTVRLPLFENSNNKDEVVLPAVFISQPGIYNGYTEGDIVFVDFEGDKLSQPIILGKLYLGAAKEATLPANGTIEASNLIINTNATLPLTTKLTVDDITTKQAIVDNRYSNYKSLLDIINAINTTEENFNTQLKNTSDHVITNITTEWLSQAEGKSMPAVDDENWSPSRPILSDGYDIWQKTTCYNVRGQVVGTPEIICLTGLAASITYWVTMSSPIHTGTHQQEDIIIKAMAKLGTHAEALDKEAKLQYKWAHDKGWTPADLSAATNTIKIKKSQIKLKTEDLLIRALHGETEYDTETVTFVSQNGPTLDLSNDSDYINYDSEGLTKLDQNDYVTSSATLYYNGVIVPEDKVTFNWELINCTTNSGATEVQNAAVTITDIVEEHETAKAICKVRYKQTTCEKTFSITKNRQGKQGNTPYQIIVENDFVAIGTDSSKILPSDSYRLTSHTVRVRRNNENIKVPLYEATYSSLPSSGLYLKATRENVEVSTINSTTIASDTTTFSMTSEEEIAESYTLTLRAMTETATTGTIQYVLYEDSVAVATAKFTIVKNVSGNPAINYWIKFDLGAHLGENETRDFTITAMKKIGANAEEEDKANSANNTTGAYLWWYKANSEVADWQRAEPNYKLTFTAENLKSDIGNNDLRIIATHDDEYDPNIDGIDSSAVYESETIPYSPKDTPILDLTNDSDALSYNYNGNIVDGDKATTRAIVYLNGTEVTGNSYNWTVQKFTSTDEWIDLLPEELTDCVESNTLTTDSITIKGIPAECSKLRATCIVVYTMNEQITTTLEKTFTVFKQLQGPKGDAAVSYWLNYNSAVHLGTLQTTNLVIEAMCKEGTEGIEKADTSARLFWRFSGESTWTDAKNYTYSLTFRGPLAQDKDIEIIATHDTEFTPEPETSILDEEVYEAETITYSPLNTPALDLSNDSAALTYTAGGDKIGESTVSTTPTLYLNGTALTNASYIWNTAPTTIISPSATASKTLTVEEIDDNTVTFRCIAFENKYGTPEAIVYRDSWTESEWNQPYNTEIGRSEPWTNAPAIAEGTIFVVVSKATDTGICHISWWRSLGDTDVETPKRLIGTNLSGPNLVYYEKEFTVSRQIKGENTFNYSLEWNSHNIQKQLNEDGETFSSNPKSLIFKCRKVEGSTISYLNEFKIKHKIDDGTETTDIITTGSFEIETAAINKSLFIELYVEDVKWDSQTVWVSRDGIDGDDYSGVLSQYAYLWTDSYESEPDRPENDPAKLEDSLLKDTAKNTWTILNTAPDTESLPIDWKLVFMCHRTYSSDVSDLSAVDWSSPAVFHVKDAAAYNVTKTAAGLFGFGQGVYYTYDNTQVLESPPTITINESSYSAGARINETTTDIAEWIALGVGTSTPLDNVENRKKVIKVYIDAEYIRTGYLTVGQDSDNNGKLEGDEIIFKAGFDQNGTNPVVKIAGFDVSTNSITATEATGQRGFIDPFVFVMPNLSSISETLNITSINIFNPGKLLTDNISLAGTQYEAKAKSNPWLELIDAENNKAYIGFYLTTSTHGDSETLYDSWELYEIVDGKLTNLNSILVTATVTSIESKVFIGPSKIELTNADNKVLIQNGTLTANAGNIAGFNMEANKLTAGSGTAAITLQTDVNAPLYSAAEYILFEGAQSIDTGLCLNFNEGEDAIEIVAAATTASQNGMIFGQWNDADNEQLALYHYKDGATISLYAYVVSEGEQLGIPTGFANTELGKHTYKFINNELFVDKVSKGSFSGPTAAASKTTCIGSGRMSTGSPNWFYNGKIYSCKIWRKGILIRHYIPAYKYNEYGFFDIVHNTFAGSTTVTKLNGVLEEHNTPNIVKNGIEYERLSYIENDGESNYINTGVAGLTYDKGFSVEVDFTPNTNTGSDNRCCLFSNYKGSASSINLSLEVYQNTNSIRFYSNGTNITTNIAGVKLNEINKAIFSYYNGTATAILNGTSESSSDTRTGSVGDEFRIFVDKDTGQNPVGRFSTFNVPFKLYGLKVYSGGELVADFLPVKNKTTNEVGLLNVVNGVFKGNGDTSTGKVAFKSASYSSTHKDEFKAIYLGSPDENVAPFSVTNTGKLTATAGTVGGFSISDSAITSADNSLLLNKNGGIIATAGTIGGFSISDSAITSADNSLQLNKNEGIIATAGTIGGFSITDNEIHSTNNNLILHKDGKINAKDGSIGGFTLTDNYLFKQTDPQNDAAPKGFGAPESIAISAEGVVVDPTVTQSIGGVATTTLSNQKWRFLVGNNFGITSNGVCYADALNVVRGKIGSFDLLDVDFGKGLISDKGIELTPTKLLLNNKNNEINFRDNLIISSSDSDTGLITTRGKLQITENAEIPRSGLVLSSTSGGENTFNVYLTLGKYILDWGNQRREAKITVTSNTAGATVQFPHTIRVMTKGLDGTVVEKPITFTITKENYIDGFPVEIRGYFLGIVFKTDDVSILAADGNWYSDANDDFSKNPPRLVATFTESIDATRYTGMVGDWAPYSGQVNIGFVRSATDTPNNGTSHPINILHAKSISATDLFVTNINGKKYTVEGGISPDIGSESVDGKFESNGVC